jgi:hypothetical protein
VLEAEDFDEIEFSNLANFFDSIKIENDIFDNELKEKIKEFLDQKKTEKKFFTIYDVNVYSFMDTAGTIVVIDKTFRMKRLFYKEKIHYNDIFNNIFHGEGDKFSIDVLVELFLKDEYMISVSPLVYNANRIVAYGFDHTVFNKKKVFK